MKVENKLNVTEVHVVVSALSIMPYHKNPPFFLIRSTILGKKCATILFSTK